ncbi:MAG TPA: universal stress protein [Gemmataceae bacterium]|nr:universal stress protein [Gemmataceae bacterium]
MIRSVFVPLDGSPFGEHALPLALAVARRAGASLEVALVHVPPTPAYAPGAPPLDYSLDGQIREQERAYLAGVVSRLAGADVPVTSALLEGAVTEEIEERVKARDIDLVVLTTHGRGAFSRFWLGSVTDHLIRRLEVPALVVRPGEKPPDFRREPLPRHFLLPLDGSPLAERALGPATDLARLAGATCTLLRVVVPQTAHAYDLEWTGAIGMDEDLLRRDKDAAETYLERVARQLGEQGLTAEVRVVTHSRPAEAILEAGRSTGADLVALATHGYGGVKRVLLGSVADKVLRGATTPVLVYRPAGPA